MRTFFVTLLAVLISFSAHSQLEGIQKGDNEITFSGSANSLIFGENTNVTGTAFLSYGRYFSKRFIMGIAPGLTYSFNSESSPATTTSYNLQIFTNLNLADAQPVIPYLRFVFYKFDLEEPDTEYIQAGGGIKYFFAERAAWDTLITYGRGIGNNSGNTFLLLTGLAFIF